MMQTDCVARVSRIEGEQRHADGGEDAPASLAIGDRAAIGDLYDRYGRLAYSLALQLVRDPALAEDIVQDAFLTIWRRAEDFDGRRGTVRSWLLTIVHHRAIDVLRSARYRRDGKEGEVVLQGLQANCQVEHEAQQREEARVVRQALGVLPHDQRLAVDLAYFGGYSYPEIAQFLGLPVGTVKSRLRLALRKLRLVVGERDGTGCVGHTRGAAMHGHAVS